MTTKDNSPSTPSPSDASAQASRDWWRTEIIDMQPGVIRFRGYPIEKLIGHVGFVEMIWLMTRGELPGGAKRLCSKRP